MRSVLVILCLLLSAMAMQPAASAEIPYSTFKPRPTDPRNQPGEWRSLMNSKTVQIILRSVHMKIKAKLTNIRTESTDIKVNQTVLESIKLGHEGHILLQELKVLKILQYPPAGAAAARADVVVKGAASDRCWSKNNE